MLFSIGNVLIAFILVTLLYGINIVFLSKKVANQVENRMLVVVNIIALCLGGVVVVLPLLVITFMSLGTGNTSVTEVQFTSDFVISIVLTISSFIYFIVINFVLTIRILKNISVIKKKTARLS